MWVKGSEGNENSQGGSLANRGVGIYSLCAHREKEKKKMAEPPLINNIEKRQVLLMLERVTHNDDDWAEREREERDTTHPLLFSGSFRLSFSISSRAGVGRWCGGGSGGRQREEWILCPEREIYGGGGRSRALYARPGKNNINIGKERERERGGKSFAGSGWLALLWAGGYQV